MTDQPETTRADLCASGQHVRSADPATISGQDWRDLADDLEAVLAVERFVGRPDDEYGRVLDPVLDATSWRAHL